MRQRHRLLVAAAIAVSRRERDQILQVHEVWKNMARVRLIAGAIRDFGDHNPSGKYVRAVMEGNGGLDEVSTPKVMVKCIKYL